MDGLARQTKIGSEQQAQKELPGEAKLADRESGSGMRIVVTVEGAAQGLRQLSEIEMPGMNLPARRPGQSAKGYAAGFELRRTGCQRLVITHCHLILQSIA